MSIARTIAFVSPRFVEGPTVGGAETLLGALARRLAGTGCAVHFLTTCARDHFTWANARPAGRQKCGDLDVHFFPVDEDRDVESFLRVQNRISARRTVNPDEELVWLRNNVNSRALIDHLRTQGAAYDRIIMGPYLYGLIYFASQVYPTKTMLIPCLHDEPFALLAAMRTLFRSCATCIFNSEPERELALRLYGLAPEKTCVVGLGLEPFTTNAEAWVRQRGLRRPYVLYSGRREPLKGVPLLLDYLVAFRARTRRDVPVVFTGTGHLEVPAGLAGQVVDLGFVSEADKHEAMAGAAVLCHPSVNESLGIVLLEAWLAGTPALVHAGSEVLRYHCRRSNGGLWFRNYPEFEAELNLLLDQPDLRNQLGVNGQAYVRREYAWDTIEARLLAALNRTAG